MVSKIKVSITDSNGIERCPSFADRIHYFNQARVDEIKARDNNPFEGDECLGEGGQCYCQCERMRRFDDYFAISISETPRGPIF